MLGEVFAIYARASRTGLPVEALAKTGLPVIALAKTGGRGKGGDISRQGLTHLEMTRFVRPRILTVLTKNVTKQRVKSNQGQKP